MMCLLVLQGNCCSTRGGPCLNTFVATAARLLPFSLKPMPISALTVPSSGCTASGWDWVWVAALLADFSGTCTEKVSFHVDLISQIYFPGHFLQVLSHSQQ